MMLGLRSLTFFIQSPNICLKIYFNLQKKFAYGAGTSIGQVMPILKSILAPYLFLAYPPHTHFFLLFHTHTQY